MKRYVNELQIFYSKNKKLIWLNFVFLLLVGLVFSAIDKNERQIAVSVPVLKGDVYTGDIATSTPVKVSIPAYGIEAKVVQVGITKNGNMAVPGNYEDVGWYKYGPRVGGEGNAVLAGHLDNGSGKPAVFYNLSLMRIGDEVFVETSEGERLQFIVREVRLVDYKNPPLEEIFGKLQGEHLNLITCDGTWDPVTKTYTFDILSSYEIILDWDNTLNLLINLDARGMDLNKMEYGYPFVKVS